MSQIVKTMLSDGPTKSIISIFLQSDGIEGELTNYVLLDPQLDLVPIAKNLTIQQIWYSFSWFDALLTFDDLVPYPSWELTRDADNYFDFRYFGGLKDRSGIDSSGKLFLTTNGFAPVGSVGTLIIEVKKN